MQDTLKASEDLKYLLDRGYPKQTALNFVSNRYRLGPSGKNRIYRYVYSEKDIALHREKLMDLDRISGRDIIVDGYNVLITVEAVLCGDDVVASMDGMLRDTRGVFSNYRFSEETKKALNAILKLLTEKKPGSATFIFDSQISKSGDLASYVRKKLAESRIKGDSRTSRSADKEIVDSGMIAATTDSVIIEKSPGVVDIGFAIYARQGKT